MKLNTLIVALFVAAVAWVGLPRLSRGEPQAYEVILTAYTCEAHPRNPMYPCGRLRWGGDVTSPGMACPPDWRNRVMTVPGYGTRRCDDTPARAYMNGLPHVDVRVATYAEARQLGVRRVTIYAAESAPVVVAPPVAPSWTTPEAALQLAQKSAPNGDAKTAMVRLLRTETVQGHFPALLEGVNLVPAQPLWLVTLWVPPSDIPAGTRARPNPDAEIAAQFFLYDAKTGTLLTNTFVSKDVLETIGWLSSESIDLSQ